MAYKDNFSESIELNDPDESTALVIKIFMKEGELQFRDKLADLLAAEVSGIDTEVFDNSDLTWQDGLNYVIHLLKEVDLDD